MTGAGLSPMANEGPQLKIAGLATILVAKSLYSLLERRA
jgi:hypothetical protein